MNPDQALDLLRSAVPELPERPGRVRLELEGDLASVVVEHPEARNALTGAMMVQLADAIRALESWEGLAVVLRAAPGPVFCAGGHLGDLKAGLLRKELGHAMAVALGDALDRLRALPCWSIAAIDGLAMGGGAELITATDWRWASPSARVHFVHTALGVVPGWGGAGRLASIVGRSQALRVLSEARPLDAEACVKIGLVDRVCADPVQEARAWTEALAPRREALRAAKRQVVSPEAHAEPFAERWGSEAHRAALSAR
jgi:ethylmalonyl-CoA/methylmalonyl-CoA decarboxylase